jgi:hypothetical protein
MDAKDSLGDRRPASPGKLTVVSSPTFEAGISPTRKPTVHLLTHLAINNESVQIQVCSDYNFHSEESFKINYWTKVIECVMDEYKSDFQVACISACTLRQWWKCEINSARRLVGLEKILKSATTFPRGLMTLSNLKLRFDHLWLSPSLAEQTSIASRTVSMLRKFARGIWNYAMAASPTEDDGGEIFGVDPDEPIFISYQVEKFTQHVLKNIWSKEGTDSGLVLSELDIQDALSSTGVTVAEGIPFCAISKLQLVTVVMVTLVDKFGAIAFVAGSARCVKIFPKTNPGQGDHVTEADKAYILNKFAIRRLGEREEELTRKWSQVDEMIKNHLSANRKQLALSALKE